jgi:hypothetical protein
MDSVVSHKNVIPFSCSSLFSFFGVYLLYLGFYLGSARSGGVEELPGRQKTRKELIKVPSEAFHETPRANSTAMKERKNDIALPGGDGISRKGV